MPPNHKQQGYDTTSTASASGYHESVVTVDASKAPPSPPYVSYHDANEESGLPHHLQAPPRPRLAVTNPHLRECLAEFFGSFIMVCFGLAVNNQVALSNGGKGTWLSINMCWGVAIMVAVHCAEGVSGAHLNPAVTVTMAVYNRLPWRKVPGYVLAQVLGCFVGALSVFILYHPLISLADPDHLHQQEHFCGWPSEHISLGTAFYTEALATAMLLVGVFCITDQENRPASPFNTPVHFMFLIWAIGMAFGWNTGYQLNPARDFGPRLFLSLAGWGFKMFSAHNYYFWVPLVAPCVGGILGAGAYKLFIQNHHPPRRELTNCEQSFV